MNASSTIGGIAGAAALTLLNEVVKKFDKNAPRLDLLGQNALARIMKGNEMLSKTAQKFFPMAGDLITNSMYYGMARGKNTTDTFIRGGVLGLTAGIGAVTLPKQLGLEQKHTAQNTEKTLMTIGWYLIGGLVAAAVISAIDPGPKKTAKRELKSALTSASREAGKKIADTVKA